MAQTYALLRLLARLDPRPEDVHPGMADRLAGAATTARGTG